MIRLHTWTTPNGRKISIALEELGLPYEVRAVNLGKNEQMTPEFLKLNPNHKIPVLEDDGQVIWESGAILLHLGEKHDPKGIILPKDARKRHRRDPVRVLPDRRRRPEPRPARRGAAQGGREEPGDDHHLPGRDGAPATA